MQQVTNSLTTSKQKNPLVAFFEKDTTMNILKQKCYADPRLAERLRDGLFIQVRDNPALSQCTPDSVFKALSKLAMLNLDMRTPNTAVIVPYKGVATLQLGYNGLREIARRGGAKKVMAYIVYKDDEFHFECNPFPQIKYVKNCDGDQNDWRYAVAVAEVDGEIFAEVMTKSEVVKIRDNSNNYKFAKDKSNTIWSVHETEMARKTVLRRLLKNLPCGYDDPEKTVQETGKNDWIPEELPAFEEPAFNQPPVTLPPAETNENKQEQEDFF